MSTTLKLGFLRVLEKMGKSSLVSESVFGFPYRISLGDMFSENPYYNNYSNVGEILACAAWVNNADKPVIYDIGAHCGFISTQLACILKKQSPVIIAFEPIPPTYTDLILSIEQFNLEGTIRPIPVALSNSIGMVRMNYSKWASMFAQIEHDAMQTNNRSGSKYFNVLTMPLDHIMDGLGVPSVVKIDVEGWEVPVLQGVQQHMKEGKLKKTAWCLEWNPEALRQTGYSKQEFFEVLPEYRYYYLNDYEGQLIPLLQEVPDPLVLDHVCNLFAIHTSSTRHESWKENFDVLKEMYGVAVSERS